MFMEIISVASYLEVTQLVKARTAIVNFLEQKTEISSVSRQETGELHLPSIQRCDIHTVLVGEF